MPVTDKEKKILIVGAGIAGSTLALELSALNHSVTLFDNLAPNSSSRIAAGLLNPIVPKGVKKTWNCDNIYPNVFEYYQNWAKFLGSNFIHSYKFLNIHANAGEQLEWDKRVSQPEMQDWIMKAMPQEHALIDENSQATWVNHCGRLDVAAFLIACEDHFESKNQFIRAEFDYFKLKIELQDQSKLYTYPISDIGNNSCIDNTSFDAIVFCEGVGILQNPWFNDLFFDPTGGDILKVKIPNFNNQNCIVKQKQWLVPTGELDTYLVGSNFHKQNLSTTPQVSDASFLLNRAKEISKCEVELIDHKRGVRPTVQNRRPYLGEHHAENGMYVFNGLGAKGSSLCSWLSPMMAKHIHNKSPLNDEVNIARFSSATDPNTPGNHLVK